MIGRREVEAAWQLIRPHIRRTPVIDLPVGALGINSRLALKLESLQVSGSFKGRGAFHKLLASKVPAAGIIAASGGNHGAAAAYALAESRFPGRDALETLFLSPKFVPTVVVGFSMLGFASAIGVFDLRASSSIFAASISFCSRAPVIMTDSVPHFPRSCLPNQQNGSKGLPRLLRQKTKL